MKHPLPGAQILAEARSCTTLAIPLAIAQVTDSITGLVDTMMMGWLGGQTIAAGALGTILFNYLLWITTAIVSAVSPLTAQAYGAGDPQTIRRVLHQGFYLTLLLGIPLALVLGNGGALLSRFGQDAPTVALADQYLKAIAWGFVPAIGFSVLKSFVAALSRPRAVMVVVFLGILLNIGGNYVLMFGKLGFPALGLAGIGWSSTLAFWAMFLALLGYVLCRNDFKRYALWSGIRVHSPILMELLRIGLPIGGLIVVEDTINVVGTLLVGHLGATALAAHQIVFQTAGIITYQWSSGFSTATTIRVGQWMGKEDTHSSQRAGFVGIGITGLCMLGFSLAFLLIPRPIIGLYLDLTDTGNLEIIELATTLLTVAALFQVIDGIQVAAAGALRGLKDTQMTLWVGMAAHWCVGLPVGYTLGLRLGFGVIGLWLGVASAMTITAIVLTWRFRGQSSKIIDKEANPQA